MNKSRYTIPTIKVKLIDNEDILAVSPTITINTTSAGDADEGEEAGSKSTSTFDTDDNDSWK